MFVREFAGVSVAVALIAIPVSAAAQTEPTPASTGATAAQTAPAAQTAMLTAGPDGVILQSGHGDSGFSRNFRHRSRSSARSSMKIPTAPGWLSTRSPSERRSLSERSALVCRRQS